MTLCKQKDSIEYWNTINDLQPVTNGLVMAYFSDKGSSDWIDRIGNNTLVNMGNVSRAEEIHPSGIFGKPFRFISNDNLSVLQSSTNPINGSSEWTICMMVKLEDDIPRINPITGEPMYWEWQLLGIETDGKVFLYYVTYNQLRLDIGVGPSIIYTLGTSTNEWIHVSITSGSSGSQLYINGVSVGSTISSYTPNSTKFNIGKHFFGTSSFGGQIASVLVYNRVLFSNEINTNYIHEPIYYIKDNIN